MVRAASVLQLIGHQHDLMDQLLFTIVTKRTGRLIIILHFFQLNRS